MARRRVPVGPGAGAGVVPARCSPVILLVEDVAMRDYDFSPLTRSTIGFERLFDLINNTQRSEPGDQYPPYDIVHMGPDAFRISLALAGFTPDEIAITAQQNLLSVAGRKVESAEGDYLYRGIASRDFQRQFSLADHVEVESAAFDNGLLHIDLVRRIPEAMKPRRISINTAGPAPKREKGKADGPVRAA
jgi:molecular chaperone IbpA